MPLDVDALDATTFWPASGSPASSSADPRDADRLALTLFSALQRLAEPVVSATRKEDPT